MELNVTFKMTDLRNALHMYDITNYNQKATPGEPSVDAVTKNFD